MQSIPDGDFQPATPSAPQVTAQPLAEEILSQLDSCLDPAPGEPQKNEAPVIAEDVEAEQTFGTFYLGDSEFALPVDRVREVVPFPTHITPIPLSEDFVYGLFGLRGEVLPIVDAGHALGIEAQSEDSTDRRVAIVSRGSDHIGVVFERTGEVVRVGPDQVAPMKHAHGETSVLEGVLQLDDTSRFVQLLSVEVLGAMSGDTCGSHASTVETPTEAKTYRKAIVAKVGEFELAFPIEDVLEIQEELELHSSQPYYEHCRGVVQLRGEVRTVMDFSRVLGLPVGSGQHKLLFVLHQGACVGLEVDALVETYEYAQEDVAPWHEVRGSSLDTLCAGVIPAGAQRHLLVVDVPALFDHYHILESIAALGGIGKEPATEVARGVDEDGFFTFRVRDVLVGLELEDVREVCLLPSDVLLATESGEDSTGMMSLRGTVVPLRDVRGERSDVERGGGVVILVDHQNGRRGLVVDSVENIVRGQSTYIPKSQLPTSSGRSAGSLLSLAKSAVLVDSLGGDSTLLLVLDPDLLFGS